MPGAKALSRTLLFHAILHVTGALIVSLPRDCLNISGNQLSHISSFLPKPIDVNQVVCSAIAILSNTRLFWATHLCKDSVKFVSKAPGSKTLTVRFHFVGAPLFSGDLQTLLGALSIGRSEIVELKTLDKIGESIYSICYHSVHLCI